MNGNPSELAVKCRKSAIATLFGAIVLCLLVLWGCATGNAALTNLFPEVASRHGVLHLSSVDSTGAICMALYAIALLVIMRDGNLWHNIGFTLTSLVMIIGWLNLLVAFSPTVVEPVRLLRLTEQAPGVTFPFPMSLQVSIATIVMGAGLLLYKKEIRGRFPSQWIALFSVLCPILVLGGAASGKQILCTFGKCYTPSVGYAFIVLLLGSAMFLSQADMGPAKTYASETLGGIMIRRMTFLVLIPAVYLVCKIPSFIIVDGNPVLNLDSCKAIAGGGILFMIGYLFWSGARVADELARDLKETSSKLEDQLVQTQAHLEEARQSQALNQVSYSRYKMVCLNCAREYEDGTERCVDDDMPLERVVDTSLLGTIFAEKYKIIEELGSGGMATVYRAQHTVLGKEFAVKVLADKSLADNNSLKRFTQEAKVAGKLDHPNIVATTDFGLSSEGRAYLVMDYIVGVTLGDYLLRKKRLTIEEMWVVTEQLCEGLQHAHAMDVVHRDLKPGNVMLVENDASYQVKIVDFGLAKIIEDESDPDKLQKLTRTGECFGSPLYMSPEQCTGRLLDHRSDIYSLCCILYECLAGVPPIYGENVIDTLKRQVTDEPTPFQSEIGLSRATEAVIMKGLSKVPKDRQQSAMELKMEFYRSLNAKPARS